MRKPGIKMLLLAGILLAVCNLYTHARQFPADTVACSVTHFTDEDGLPQNSVKSITTDEQGFIWFATEDGIVRFDGRNFVVFTRKNTGVRSSRFSRIQKVPQEHSLYAMNSEHQWLRIRSGWAFADRSIAEKKSKEEQRYRRITGRDNLRAVGMPDLRQSYLRDTSYRVHTGIQEFYLCTKDKVAFYENDRLLSETAFAAKTTWNFFPLDGHLYHLDNRYFITGFTGSTAVQLQLQGDITYNAALSPEKKISIFWDQNSPIVLLYFNGAFYQLRRTSAGSLTTQLIMRFNIEDINVNSFYYDDTKEILFIGTADEGLYVLKRKKFTALVSGFKDPGDIFYGQMVYKGNSLLTPQGTLLTPGQKPVQLAELRKISKLDRYSITGDKKGFIWLSGFNDLYKLEPGLLEPLQKWTFPEGIGTMHEGLNSTLWIALRKRGLYALGMDDGRAQPRFVISMPGISCINQQGGLLWLGSDNGLFRMDTGANKVDTVTGLKGMYIRSIYVTAPDQLWITTYGNGFFLYEKDRLVKFPVDKDNFLSTAHCIIEDGKGFFWITTNKGLFQVAKKDLLSFSGGEQQEVYYYYYDKENGFNTNEFNGGCDPCAVKMPDGAISLPSLNGLVLFDPAKLEPLLPGNNIFIDDIQLDNHRLPFSNKLTLPRGFNQFHLSVSSPYLGNKKNISFSYALTRNGDTPLWLPMEEGAVSFSNLRSGTYTLSIRKLNGFGKNNYTQNDIVLFVPAAWYQSAWFLVSLILLAVLLTYLATRIRVRYILKNNRLLEMKIAERTEKLQQTLNHLQHTQADLHQKTYLQEHLIAAISHDIRTPMKYLVLTLQGIHEGLMKENNSSFIKTAESAKEYVSQLDATVQNLLQYIKAQKDKSYLLSDSFSLYSFVTDIITLHDEPARHRQVRFINNVPDSILVSSSRQLLSIILRNIIDNAVKNTFDGSITISARQTSNTVDISIWDTGKGMPDPLLTWLNNDAIPSAPGGQDAGFSASSGLGLIMVKELCTILRIRLSAISKPGEGSVVHLALPREKS